MSTTSCKLCAIYTVWGDWDLLYYSHWGIKDLVDGVIIIYSETSNYGEQSRIRVVVDGVHFQFEPDLSLDPRTNETDKRNYGLQKARELGYTHFIMMDADEFYLPEEFNAERKRIEDSIGTHKEIFGLVCRVKCYFQSPTLTIGYDTTLVPFIHKITPNLKFAFNREYPFAWTLLDGIPFTQTKQIRIDPTRSMNISGDRANILWSEITMHHMSWIRSDIKKKIRNSTARMNIEKSTIVHDYLNARPGYYCQFYGKTLEECPNVFGLPEIADASLRPQSEERP